AIGDFVLTLPAVKLLRENFPDTRVEILGYKHIIALAVGRYYADDIRSIEYSALAGFFVPNGELASDLVEYFSGFQQIVSYLYDPDNFFEENIRRCGVKHYLSASPKIEGGEHAAHQLARPLQRLALFLDDPAAKLFPSAEDRLFAEQFVKGACGPLIAIHPGSGSERKNWPLRHWRVFGKMLSSLDLQPTLVMVGGEADEATCDALQNAWSGSPVLPVRGLPLVQLAAVLERCLLFIGHDSGISHIAAAVGTPAVLLFGGTDPKIWAPANPNAKILQAPGGMLDSLTPETVFQAVMEMMA
ncbi:MAG: glycosyltransferase family 9 protein, partial [Verrucomicrobiota bacterium]